MASGKTLQSTIEISGVLSPSLQAAINKAVDRLEEMSKETLASAGAAEKLTAEISAQESVLKNLQKGYADYIVSGKESSDEAQTLADKIQELSSELDENRETLQAAEKAAKRLADMQDDTADAYTKLEREINSQQSELSALRREYANVVLEQGESSDEARQLASRISDLSGELNQNKQKLNEAERAADAFGDALEDAGEKAESSSGGFTIMKGAIADLVADAIAKAVEAFKELATEGDTALAMLEAKTGSTSAEMQGFEDVMYEVYNANYGDSLGDVSEALGTVIQMTDDLDNASLAKVTKNAIALEDVFGFDVTESMRAANSLMDKFGITSDEAFNLIVQGAQKGLNQNDDLLDTINEYSVQFKDAGYTADDMFNMLANGVESGTWSVDKLGDAVKEFNIRASDGTITDAIKENAKAFGMTEKEAKTLGAQIEGGNVEAYQKLLDKLEEVDDDATRYQMGVAMFGTMWEDLGEDTVRALMNTQGELSKTSDAMAKMDSAAYDTLESSLSQLGRTIKAEVAQPIADKLIPVTKIAVNFVTSKVAPAVDWLLNNLPTLGVVLAGVAAAVVAFKWSAIVDGIKNAGAAFKAFGALLSANPISLIIIGITALVAAFVYLWNNCEGFRDFWINLWEKIKTAASGAAEWLGSCWQSISSALSTAWQTIKNVVQVGILAVKSLLSAAFQIITLPFRFIWENCKETVIAAWTNIQQTIATKITAAKEKVTAVTSAIANVASMAWQAISSTASTLWSQIQSGISEKINAAKSAVSSAVNGVKSTVSSVFGQALSTVQSIFSNIYDTISSKINAAKSAVSNAISVIKSAFNFSWSLPPLKLPHFSINGSFSFNPLSVPKLSVDWYKDGGILTGPTIFGASGDRLLAGGEAGAEAVLPLAVLWDKLETMIRSVFNSASATGGTSGEGLTATAGRLLTLDDFSLGSLADGTNVVIYYDFSGFTWSPQIQTNGSSNDEDDLMARLRAHEAEFFDWLEEFIKMREVAQYA